MIVNSKQQRSAEKITHRDTRNKPLPVIIAESALEPDQCPILSLTSDSKNPLDINVILARVKTQTQPPQQSRTRSIKSQIVPSNINDNEANILCRLVLTTVELERVTAQNEILGREGNQVLVWREKYEDILRRYKEGESSFYKLAQRNKQLESQLKFSSQNDTSGKQIQIKNLKEQLKTAREVSQSNISMLQSSNRRLESERNQLRQLLQTTNIQKAKLQNEQSFVKTQTFKHESDYEKLNSDLIFSKQQQFKLQEQNKRLLQNISSLTEKLTIKQRLYQQDLNKQISQYKKNADIYLNQCQRLTDEVTRLNQKAAKEHNNERLRTETQIALKEQIRRIKLEMETLERSKDDSGHLKIKNEGLERQIAHLRESNRSYQERAYVLQGEIKKLEFFRLENSQIRMNYESIKREADQKKMETEIQRSDFINRIKIMEKDVEFYRSQQKSRDQLVERLNKENTELQKQIYHNQDADLLKKHLQLSVEQIHRMYSYTKTIITELTGKISWLSKEKQQWLKKQQYQEFQLQKLYQVLKTRKEQLQNCYKTIQSIRKGNGDEEPSQDLNQMLRNRRQQLL